MVITKQCVHLGIGSLIALGGPTLTLTLTLTLTTPTLTLTLTLTLNLTLKDYYQDARILVVGCMDSVSRISC